MNPTTMYQRIRILLGFGSTLGVSGCFYHPTGSVGLETDPSAASDGPYTAPTTTPASVGPDECGGGGVGSGECDDDTAGESADDTDECTSICTPATCGDGIIGPDEECDDGEATAMCDADCTASSCGDGMHNAVAGEECDGGGESAKCNADCSLLVCGDGKINATAGELCDDGNTTGGDLCSPACVATKIVDLAVDTRHTCVVFESGPMRCWGANENGQLGLGNSVSLGDDPDELPADDVVAGGKVVQVALGNLHTCARLDGGAVRCWGHGLYGQLGYGDGESLGDTTADLPPLDLSLGSPALQVAAGEFHTCAVVDGGSVKCWGRGNGGQLGYGSPNNVLEPGGAIIAELASVQQVVLGSTHGCALGDEGEVRCWGTNSYGQLGLGSTITIGDDPGEVPGTAEVSDETMPVMQLAAGAAHTCALLVTGAVRCWGSNGAKQLGSFGGTIGDNAGEMPPADVPLGPDMATQIVAGEQHSCALMANKRVKCWGKSPENGHPMDINTPGQFPPLDVDVGGDVVMLASHRGRFTCAVLTDNTLRCWGMNVAGQLGYGHTDPIGDDETPAMAGPVPF